jgi:hypothetical protein
VIFDILGTIIFESLKSLVNVPVLTCMLHEMRNENCFVETPRIYTDESGKETETSLSIITETTNVRISNFLASLPLNNTTNERGIVFVEGVLLKHTDLTDA